MDYKKLFQEYSDNVKDKHIYPYYPGTTKLLFCYIGENRHLSKFEGFYKTIIDKPCLSEFAPAEVSKDFHKKIYEDHANLIFQFIIVEERLFSLSNNSKGIHEDPRWEIFAQEIDNLKKLK